MADFRYIVDQGVIVPDTAETRERVVADWRTAFGQDLDVSPETPQGIFITQDVEIRDGVARNNADLANQINPDIAGGVWLDAIWRLTRGNRRPATRSVIPGVQLGGIPGTLVPAGSSATVADTGERFLTVAPVVLGPTGTAVVDMRAELTGPVAAPPGSLTEVASSVLGWETVTNPNSAVLGSAVESDIASRRRRRQTLALQGTSMPEAIISRLYDIEGVRSLTFRENITDTTMVIDGILVRYHSVWVCVEGGTDEEIARALLDTKTVGAGWSGDIEVFVTEPFSGQTYPVRFDRPEEISIFVRVTVRASSLDAHNLVPDAIVAYAEGEIDGEAGLVVGANVSPFELAGAVNKFEPRLFVARVETSLDGVTWSADEFPVGLDQVARVTRGAVTVVEV